MKRIHFTCPARAALSAAALLALATLCPSPAQAATRTWNCDLGKFEVANCWTPTGVPGPLDDVVVIGRPASGSNPGAEVRYGASSGTRSINILTIQQPVGAPTSALFVQDGGALTTSTVQLTGAMGGQYVQHGGTHTSRSIRVTGSADAAVYRLSGGALDVTTDLWLGGGSVSNPSTFAHLGGSANIKDLSVGKAGAGTYLLTDTPGLATPLLTAPLLTVGQDAAGTFTQAGARSSVTATTLVVGSQGAGRYAMTTGTLVATNVTVGKSAQGTLVLDGGRQTFARLTLGEQASGNGVWQMDSGTAELGSLRVGQGGRGEVLHTGGSVLVSGPFTVDDGSRYLLAGNGGIQNANTISNRGTFEHRGGIVSGTISNDGTYVAQHPIQGVSITGGRLVNRGQASLLSSISFNDGLRNEALMSVLPTGLTLTLHGSGFDNAGGFAIGGGTLQGSGPMRSSGSFSGHGRIAGTGGAFTNSGLLRQEGGTLVIANSVGAVNSGRWTLQPLTEMQLSGNAVLFDNQGQLALNEGRITGSGQLSNGVAGIITGSGSISTRFTNQGTLALAAADRVLVTGAFSNTGLVDMGSAGAVLSGSVLTNTGLVTGRGRINNPVANQAGGRIQADGGVLVLAGAVTNTGMLVASPGGTLLVQGLLAQLGRVQLEGGTLDTASQALVNQGVISGFGTLRSGGIDNQGQMQFSAGAAQIHGSVLNQGQIIVSGGGVVNFHGNLRAEEGSELRVSEASAAVFFESVSLATGAALTGTGTFYFEGGISVGDSPGAAKVDGDVVFGQRALFRTEIGGKNGGIGHDLFTAGGELSFGGTLQVSWLNGFQPQEGEGFDLFDWGSTRGRFAAIDFSAAPLPDGLRWDTSQLYNDGYVSITAVPEPGSWALMAGGLLAMAIRRQRALRLQS